MVKNKYNTMNCPYCKRKLNYLVCDNLNAKLNPEENKRFLEGNLFRFTCTCGNTTGVDYPMIYNNPEKKIMIHYVDYDKVPEVAAYIRKMQEFNAFGSNDYKYRIVTSQNELIEKANIFANDLDDRIVEIVKVYGFSQIREDFPDAEIDEILFYIDSDTDEMNIRFVGSRNISMIVAKDFYDNICSKFEGVVDDMGNNDIIVNGPWALEFLKEYR